MQLVLHDVNVRLLFNFKVPDTIPLFHFSLTLCTLTDKSTAGVSSTSVCIVGESSCAATATNARINEISSECSSETSATLRAKLGAGRARAHTKQEQGIAETEVLCHGTATGMKNSLKNEYCLVVLTERRDRIKEEVS